MLSAILRTDCSHSKTRREEVDFLNRKKITHLEHMAASTIDGCQSQLFPWSRRLDRCPVARPYHHADPTDNDALHSSP
jgi:hypothetical protein